MAKPLIVNADDLGASTGVNRGIFDAHRDDTSPAPASWSRVELPARRWRRLETTPTWRSVSIGTSAARTTATSTGKTFLPSPPSSTVTSRVTPVTGFYAQ